MARTIYISGPVTGQREKAPWVFREAARLLERVGFNVINPLEICPSSMAWSEALRTDLDIIRDSADGVALLLGWEGSVGCEAEIERALAYGIEVKPLDDWIEEVTCPSARIAGSASR